MYLKTLKFENLLSWKSFNMTFQSSCHQMYTGKTGAGKSTIFEGVSLGLWGRSTRGSTRSFVKQGEKKATITLLFVDKERWLQVSRSLSVTGMMKAELVFVEKTGGKRTTVSGTKPVTQFLEKLLGLNLELFNIGHYFSQTSNTVFLNLTDAQQKSILSKFIQVNQFTTLKTNVDLALKDAQQQIEGVRFKQAKIEASLEQHQWFTQQHHTPESLEESKQRLTSQKTTNAALLHDKETVLAQLNKKSSKYQQVQSTTSHKIKQMEEELVPLKNNQECFYCHTVLPATVLKNLTVALTANIATTTASYQHLTAQLTSLQKKIKQESSGVDQLSDIEEEITDQLNEVTSEQTMLAKYNPVSSKELKTQEGVLREKMGLIEEKTELLTIWKGEFGSKGFTSFLLQQLLPFLTERTNHYLEQLIFAHVTFHIEKETGSFKAELQSAVIGVLASKGQERLIQLGLFLAFHDLIKSQAPVPLDFMLLDEASDHLDPSYSEDVASLFKNRTGGQTFFISHDDEFAAHFQKRTRVRMKNKSSYLSK